MKSDVSALMFLLMLVHPRAERKFSTLWPCRLAGVSAQLSMMITFGPGRRPRTMLLAEAKPSDDEPCRRNSDAKNSLAGGDR